MHLHDLQRRAWDTAETKGLHANLNGVTVLGAREQALLACVPTAQALNALIQTIKKHGIDRESLHTTFFPLQEDIATALDTLASTLCFLAQPEAPPIDVDPADKTPGTAIRLLLMGTEVCEALEALSNGEAIDGELADVFIRGADLAEDLHIDLGSTVARVLDANDRRPHAYGTPQEQQGVHHG